MTATFALARTAAALVLLLALAGARAQSPAAPRVLDSLAERTLPCTACHGAQGRASPAGYLPRIAGKPAGYLDNQLRAFRDGGREHSGMAHLLAPLSDAYLHEIAGHFAQLELPYPPPEPPAAPPAVLARGEQLVRQGDPARRLPACTSCHGAAMNGRLPAVPGLLGLPRDYLLGQLGAWGNGLRRAATPDCMAQVVRRLSADDASAVASWLASQPVVRTMPEAAGGPAPPIDCGSGFR